MSILVDSAVALPKDNITPTQSSTSELDLCRICLCDSPEVMHPCLCKGSLGMHNECFLQFMKHHFAERKRGLLLMGEYWAYQCQLCHHQIFFRCQVATNWTDQVKLCVTLQALGVMVILSLIIAIIIVVLTQVPATDERTAILVLVISIFVPFFGGVAYIALHSIRMVLKQSSMITSITLIP